MNVYEVQTQGEKDWVASEDMLSALKYYLNLSGISIEEIDAVVELTNADLDKYYVTYRDKSNQGNKKFREVIEGLLSTEIIASTAY